MANRFMATEKKIKPQTESEKPENPYRLLELVGSGGMANVYRAIQTSLEREVAVKRLHPYLIQNQTFLARFEKEAKAAAYLRHENLVSVIDYGQDEEGYFIVMEYVRGKTLRELLEVEPLPLEAALVVAYKVALGLAYCHQEGVVHRDVKPANILLSEEGEVKLTDFGIAKGEDASITVTGTTLGSPAYMAPEQLRSMEVDRRADVFSLGVVLYEMLAGIKPFGGDSYSAVITSILTSEARPLCDVSPAGPARLSLLAAQMLEKDPDRRTGRMEEAVEKLEELLRYYGVQQKHELLKKYLSSPQKFVREARSQRIKRHLDSGIYYFHLGQGKIAEAKREFIEALRWDGENKEAREYLSRLTVDPTEPFENARATMQDELNRRLFPYGLFLLFVLGFSLYFGFGRLETATRRFETEKKGKRPSAERQTRKAPPGRFAGVAEFQPGESWRGGNRPENGVGTGGMENGEEQDEIPTPVPSSWIQVGAVPKGEESYLVVSAKTLAYITINGSLQGSVPPPKAFKLAAGRHEVVYSHPGFKTKTKSVKLKAGDSKLIKEGLRRERKDNVR